MDCKYPSVKHSNTDANCKHATLHPLKFNTRNIFDTFLLTNANAIYIFIRHLIIYANHFVKLHVIT